MYFTDKDRNLVESLKYDKSVSPRFDWLKNCFFWKDEIAYGLSADGENKLARLWVARFFIYHSELPEEKWWIPNKDFFKDAWKAAIESELKWPGFEKNRLYLCEEDQKNLRIELSKTNEL